MNPDEAALSGLCARLYRVILEAFRCAISGTSDVQLSSKVQTCGQRFKLWAAGLRMENGELDTQLEEDVEMKDSVLLLLGLILYDLHKMYKSSRLTHVLSTHGDLSLPSDRNLRNSNNLFGPEPENREDSPDSVSTSGPHDTSIIPNLGLEDESKLEDHVKWISLLLYICPNLQSFVTDSDLQEINEFVPDSDSQELEIELVEDIVDTIQQLYDLGPSLEWELTPPKTQENSGNDQPMWSEHNLQEGVLHYLRLTQDKFSEISTPLALRLAETNWARFQRLEKARATASAERAASASRKIPEKSHADSGYYTGSKSGTVQVQENIGQPKDVAIDLDDKGTEYGSFISSMDRFGAYGRLRFPAPPVEQLGLDRGKFDCTVCGSTVGPFRSKQGWRLHVIRDLAPYVCPVLECGSEQLVFDSQRSFTAHLKNYHGISSSWRCRFSECDTLFDELSSFQDHLWSSHGLSEEEDRDQMCKAWTDSTSLVQGESSCSICKDTMNVNLVQQSKHLGRHMIEIALLSIPNHSLEPDESDESDTSELTHSVVSNGPENSCNCETCGIKGEPSNMAICLACNARYHAYCLEIPTKVPTLRPDYTWYCTRCGSSNSIPHNLERKAPRVSFENPVIPEFRSLRSYESRPVQDFESHAQDCEYCGDPEEVYRLRGRLCDVGNRLAQDLCSHLLNAVDGKTYRNSELSTKLARVEMPIGYPRSIGLLKAVKKSLRIRNGTPFVSMERTHSVSPNRSTNVYVEPSEMGQSTNRAGKSTTIDNPGVDRTNTVDPPGLPLSQTGFIEQQLHEAVVERLVKTSHYGRNAIQEALARDEPSAIKDAYLIVRENQIMMENYAGAAASSVAGDSVSSDESTFWTSDFNALLDGAEKYNHYNSKSVLAFDPTDDDDIQPSVAQSPPSHARSLEGGAMSTFQGFDDVLSEEKGGGAGKTPQIVDDDHQPETNVELDLNDPQTLQFYAQLLLFKEDAGRDSMTFPSSLSPTQRRIIHTLAHHFGLWHVSQGDGSQRQLHVFKMHETQGLSPDMRQAKNSEKLAKGAEAKSPTKKKKKSDVILWEMEKANEEYTEAAELFKPQQVQKIPFGVNPKTVPCTFFKKGNCKKGKKCKFSHDYTDTRDHGEQEDPPTPPSPWNQAFEQSGPANLDEIAVLSQEKPLHKLDIEPPQPSAETKNYLLTQRQEKWYICPTCQARFESLLDLKRHSIKLHKRLYTCLECGRNFARKDTLARHNKGQDGCTGRPSSFGLKEQTGDVRDDEGMEEREKEQAQQVPDTYNQFIF